MSAGRGGLSGGRRLASGGRRQLSGERRTTNAGRRRTCGSRRLASGEGPGVSVGRRRRSGRGRNANAERRSASGTRERPCAGGWQPNGGGGREWGRLCSCLPAFLSDASSHAPDDTAAFVFQVALDLHGERGAAVALDEPEGEVEAARHAAAGDDVAGIDDAGGGDDGARRSEVVEGAVVRDGGAAFQQAGVGEDHAAGADAGDERALAVDVAQEAEGGGILRLGAGAGGSSARPTAAGDDEDFRLGEAGVGDDDGAVGEGDGDRFADGDEGGLQVGAEGAGSLEDFKRREGVEFLGAGVEEDGGFHDFGFWVWIFLQEVREGTEGNSVALSLASVCSCEIPFLIFTEGRGGHEGE